MRAAAALIGACTEKCAPCRRSLSGRLLEADPIVLAVTVGVVFGLHASRGADAAGGVSGGRTRDDVAPASNARSARRGASLRVHTLEP